MSTPDRTFARVLACVTSLMVVASSCDHACSSEAIERVPRFALVLEPAPSDPRPLAGPNEPATPYVMVDTPVVDDEVPEAPKVEPLPKPPAEIDALAIPEGDSPMPSSKEWFAARPLATSHPRCRARVVREWMTVHCTTSENAYDQPLGVVRVLAGEASDVQQWTYTRPIAKGEAWPLMTSAAVFPLHRGDRRLLELTYVSHGAHPRFDHIEAYTVSVAWLEGMKSPEIAVTE